MDSLPYFAYGSNLLLARLRQGNRCPGARRVGPARLPGYWLGFEKRSNVDRSGKCTIHRGAERAPERVAVHGVLYRIESRERAALDLVEGVGFGYERIEVAVETPASGLVPAFAYEAQRDWLAEDLRPMSWYRDLVLAGALENRLPDSLVQQLLSTPTQRDPDAARERHERRALPANFENSIKELEQLRELSLRRDAG